MHDLPRGVPPPGPPAVNSMLYQGACRPLDPLPSYVMHALPRGVPPPGPPAAVMRALPVVMHGLPGGVPPAGPPAVVMHALPVVMHALYQGACRPLHPLLGAARLLTAIERRGALRLYQGACRPWTTPARPAAARRVFSSSKLRRSLRSLRLGRTDTQTHRHTHTQINY